jgi:hypothetical protein
MIRSLNFSRQPVPNLVVAQRVLNKMASAARHYLEDETGEAMVGLVVPGDRTGIDTVYILDTISPDDSAVRQLHTFQQGDERQDEMIWWLQENWRVYRERRRASFGSALQAKWDVPLRYLGDWHKQPGFMIAPSGGDQRTALNWLDDIDNGMDFLLAPIVTLGHPSTTVNVTAHANFLTIPQGDDTHLRVDFWFIHRDVRLFQPIIPAVYPDDQLPGLPDYPWHLTNQGRVSREFARLHENELFTSMVLWNATEAPPLEVCFLTARMGSDRVLIIITPWNYPHKPPSARVAPFTQIGADEDMYDVFTDLWHKSTPVADPPGWVWSENLYLVDYIQALETALGMKTAAGTAARTADDEDETGELHVSPADVDPVSSEED